MTSLTSSCRRGSALPQGPKYESPKQRPSLRNVLQLPSVLTPAELNRTYHDHHLAHPSPKRDESADSRPTETGGIILGQDRSTVANSSTPRNSDRRRQRRQQQQQQQQQRQGSASPHGEKQYDDAKLPVRQLADTTDSDEVNTIIKEDADASRLTTEDSDDDGVHNEEDVCSVDDEVSSGDNDDDNEREDGDSTSSDDAVGDSWRSDKLSQHCRIGDEGKVRCFSNCGFVSENGYTEEQLREIDRIARVPFTPFDQDVEEDDSIPITTL